MKIEILLATMFFEKEKDNYLENMNPQCDMIIGNQSDHNLNDSFLFHGHKVAVLTRAERGVGKNRNLSLNHSAADIVIFADNDVHYYDGCTEKVEKFYTEHPDADVVIFNFRETRDNEPLHDTNDLDKKAKLRDITKFGACKVTAKRESIVGKNIQFSLLFGGGAKYSCGEDTIFLTECYRKGLNIYLCSETLGEVINRESTWFHGINDKYVFDKGALFRAMCPIIWPAAILRHIIKHRSLYKEYGSLATVIKRMFAGANEYAKTCAGVE